MCPRATHSRSVSSQVTYISMNELNEWAISGINKYFVSL